MKLLLLYLFIILLVGCGPSHKYHAVMPDIADGTDYLNGELKHKFIGEPMATRFSLKETPAFEAEHRLKIPESLALRLTPIEKGSKCNIEIQYDNGLYFCHMTPPVFNDAALIRGFNMCLLVNSLGEVKNIAWCHTPGDVLMSEDYSGIFLKPIKVTGHGSIRLEIIYNGRSKDAIKLLYREFFDNMARPAFTQELLYDLSESKTIGFRSIRIEVVDANNTGITYKIISGTL